MAHTFNLPFVHDEQYVSFLKQNEKSPHSVHFAVFSSGAVYNTNCKTESVKYIPGEYHGKEYP